MKDFDYIIIGGGCAGLTLAYELEYHDKLKNKTLAIIEKRDEYKRDKTWSYWKTVPHKFDDCVKKDGKIIQSILKEMLNIKIAKILLTKVLIVDYSTKKF